MKAIGLLAALWVCGVIQAEVREIHDLSPVFSHSKDRVVWRFLDIDETSLMNPNSAIGSDLWWKAVRKWMVEELGLNEKLSAKRADDVWEAVQRTLDLAPTEAKLPEWVSDGKQGNHRLFYVTARSANVAPFTVRQLRRAGIPPNLFLLPANWDSLQSALDVDYVEGVFFTGHHLKKKGLFLRELLSSIPRLPDVVVFADDKDYNAESVWEAVKSLPVELETYHYRGAQSTHPVELSEDEKERVQALLKCDSGALAPRRVIE